MIKRRLYTDLQTHLKNKEIGLIVGPRQSGKTTLMRLLQQELEAKGHKTVFLNLDIERDKQYFASQETLIEKIRLEIGSKPGYVFIDEIQRKENAGLFLKGIYDQNLPYKLIVSGSGSLELKEKIHESLAGRKRIFALSTVSFEEFVDFRTDYRYSNRLSQFFKLDRLKTLGLLTEYLNFGGYPNVILAETVDEKLKVLEELYQSYLERDIGHLLGVSKTESFTQLVRVLSAQIGNLVNISELSTTLSVSAQTIKHYLWYLEKTFLVNKITPYYRNLRSEISKSPIYYFHDLGLRNFALGESGNATNNSSNGFLFQNYIYNALADQVQKYSAVSINFWRTKDKAEVDFVLAAGLRIIPVEVKYSQLEKPRISRSFTNFLEKYHPKNAYIINLTLTEKIKFAETTVFFLPFYELFNSISF